MISIISGKIKLKASNFVIIDVGGVGYKVFITEDVLNKLPPEEEKAELFTHLHLRENGLELYGFLEYEELEFFELLISISGIGPKMAQGILSLAPVSRIKQAILDQDSSLLTKVSGIGKKNAQRIILELKGKVSKGFKAEEGLEGRSKAYAEAIDALLELGYNINEARKMLERIPDDIKEAGEMVRVALKG